MNTKNRSKSELAAHLFNVDILIEEQSNALAAERLLRLLNQCGFADYRIKSGMELGKLIDALEAQAQQQPASPGPVRAPAPAASASSAPAAGGSDSGAASLITDRIKTSIAENRLVRLAVNKGFGVRLNIPCRIINFEEGSQMLTVYHVDEKQVYAFTLNEIDDFLL